MMWEAQYWFSIASETMRIGMRAKPDAFKIGDRVELLLFYGLNGEARPQGTVVGIGHRRVRCKMDRHGRVVGFAPTDLRIVEKPR